jgi:hypothetical protein
VPIKRKISEFKPLFTNLAQTSHYEVRFGGLPYELLRYLSRKGITSTFIYQDAGLLCYSASLPTTSFALANITGNSIGLTENFAHTRVYDLISLDFYVDKNYNTLKFMESWMEFIASGSNNPINGDLVPLRQTNKNYIYRMQYPENYKCDRTTIVKFDRDYKKEIEYCFIGLFPSNINSLGVSYANSDILKMSVTFQYDRYISGKSVSLSVFRGDDNNNESKSPKSNNPNPETPPTINNTNNNILYRNDEYYNNFGKNDQNSTNTADFFDGSNTGPFGSGFA